MEYQCNTDDFRWIVDHFYTENLFIGWLCGLINDLPQSAYSRSNTHIRCINNKTFLFFCYPTPLQPFVYCLQFVHYYYYCCNATTTITQTKKKISCGIRVPSSKVGSSSIFRLSALAVRKQHKHKLIHHSNFSHMNCCGDRHCHRPFLFLLFTKTLFLFHVLLFPTRARFSIAINCHKLLLFCFSLSRCQTFF